jgi:SPP1 gp7 family putative phage head morphogenesis protein
MIETCEYTPANLTVHQRMDRYDPTRTTSLRNAFAGQLKKRFRELRGVIRQAIIDRDCFGLRQSGTRITALQLTPPPEGAFAFVRSQDKVDAFMRWLREQIDRGLLQTTRIPQLGEAIEEPWTNLYVQDSYKRGVIRARYELDKAGFNVPTLEFTGGIEASMSTSFHIDRVGVLFTRVFSELRGITSAMDQQISRVLAQGIIDGDGPALLARKLNAVISGMKLGDLGITDTLGRFIPAERRAVIIARTEVIRAHHQATIQEYMNWEVEGVTVRAEWSTAGDNRVCPECVAMEGNVYPLDVVMNMIPAHPQCRCMALPYKAPT